MAPGAAPASAQALLQAVKRLGTGAVERLLTELQALLQAVKRLGTGAVERLLKELQCSLLQPPAAPAAARRL
ncbi:hypothetical protein HaLaN_29157 [Haematococcus lacustris]|uniref:Uncharacterized protein n=1 Tax=Haematococcus lacustris TaxID=44745 RepID=A0A6A0AE12_HAELA|nr:hypothetical protein HaLaN_29157 [Haematococcus lacustris]